MELPVKFMIKGGGVIRANLQWKECFFFVRIISPLSFVCVISEDYFPPAIMNIVWYYNASIVYLSTGLW